MKGVESLLFVRLFNAAHDMSLWPSGLRVPENLDRFPGVHLFSVFFLLCKMASSKILELFFIELCMKPVEVGLNLALGDPRFLLFFF